MRLKGGKVLLDTIFRLGEDDSIVLSKEEMKVIFEKGVSIKIKVADVVYVHDVVFNIYTIVGDELKLIKESLTDSNDTYSIALETDTGLFGVFTD